MKSFRIEPHGRLQDWVAEENGYFRDEGLDYEFVSSYYGHTQGYGSILSPAVSAPDVKRGAFESYADGGRACDISTACHWAVNMAQEMYERTHRWMISSKLFTEVQLGPPRLKSRSSRNPTG